jgi:hypothetical protein
MGVVMDFLSMVFISVAIGLFRAKIFPGRVEIQPSYCEIWTQHVGTSCSIKLGAGFFFFCAVLVLTTVNFMVEFCTAEKDQRYGARSAWNTVFQRVKQGRFKSVYKPQSELGVRSAVHEINELDQMGGHKIETYVVDLSAIQETAADSSNG